MSDSPLSEQDAVDIVDSLDRIATAVGMSEDDERDIAEVVIERLSYAVQQRDALERARGCIQGLLARTPVRDVSETLAEIDAALAKNPTVSHPSGVGPDASGVTHGKDSGEGVKGPSDFVHETGQLSIATCAADLLGAMDGFDGQVVKEAKDRLRAALRHQSCTKSTTDYMDTPHYRVNRFVSAWRCLSPTKPVLTGGGLGMALEDLEAVVRESAPLFTGECVHQVCNVPKGWRPVPIEPTEPQWSGLARDVFMWLDMVAPGKDRSGASLLSHLDQCGRPIPEWLRVECNGCLGHLAKGDRAAIVYRAMVEAAPDYEFVAGKKP